MSTVVLIGKGPSALTALPSAIGQGITDSDFRKGNVDKLPLIGLQLTIYASCSPQFNAIDEFVARLPPQSIAWRLSLPQ